MAHEKYEKSKKDKLPSTIKGIGVASGTFHLVNTIVFAALLIAIGIFLISIGLPRIIGVGIIIMAAIMIVIDVISLKRVAAVNLQVPYESAAEPIVLEVDEVLRETIPAVMQYGKIHSVAILGTGKVLQPENTLLITNKAIWALTVPLSGADKVVANVDIGNVQWMVDYKKIINQLQQMVTRLSLQDVLQEGRAKRLMGWDELKAAGTLPFTQAISLARADGKKFGYSVRLKEDYLKACQIFGITPN